MMMIIFRLPPYQPRPRPARVARSRPLFKTMTSLAQVMVPAHGFVAAKGLIATHPNSTIRSQFWNFVKQIARGCFWASMIAAGMLVYTAFTAKWKERGFPVIPITALMAAEQALGGRIPGQPGATVIPLAGAGSAQAQTGSPRREERRQTSLLDLDEYEG